MSTDELRKRIGSNLQKQRKAAGYKSAKAFAEKIGMTQSAYTAYEQGHRGLSYEKAWEIADVLDCSLDELGGREFHPPEASAPPGLTPPESELVENYRASAPQWRQNIAMTARAAAGESKEVAEGAAHEGDVAEGAA